MSSLRGSENTYDWNAYVEALAQLESRDASASDDPALHQLKAEVDTLAELLRHTAPADAIAEEPACERFVARLRAVSAHSVPDVTALKQFGPYEILEPLGRGGMGTVCKALHCKLQKIVALKMLAPQRTSDPNAVARFEREMATIGGLAHANIVAAYDAGEIDGCHYLAMEFVEGADLSQLSRRHGLFAVADACEIIRQAAEGLSHAHDHGIIHRDIKPSNLMLTPEGQVKILDMGLALLDETPPTEKTELTADDQLMGTLDYMAPEQAKDSHQVDIRSDIYSLGATLYKLLCGEAPFAAKSYDTPMKKLWALATAEIEPIRDKRPEIPKELAAIVERMLAKNPEVRFATCAEVVDALQPFAAGIAAGGLLQQDVDDTVTPNELHERASKRPAKKKSRPTWVSLFLTAGMAACVIAASVFTIRAVTDKGTVVIEAYGPKIEVTVKRHGKVVDGFRVKQRPDGASYYSGSFEILIKGGKPDGVSIENEKFTLTRGKTVIVRITRVKKDDRAPSTPKDLPRLVAKWVLKHDRGAKVFIGTARRGSGGWITDAAQLPKTDFQIGTIQFESTPRFDPSGLKYLVQLPKPIDLVLSKTRFKDEHLEQIKNFDGLVSLRLNGTDVTADGLRHLASTKNLQGLTIRDTMRSGPAAWVHLQKIKKLTGLQLAVTSLGDDELELIGKLTNLSNLGIKGWQKNPGYPDAKEITNRGLAHLSGLTRLTALTLEVHPRVTDEGLIHLKQMKFLQKLEVRGCAGITGTGLKHLTCAEWLTHLHLGRQRFVNSLKNFQKTAISDAGMAEIARFKNLTYLAIDSKFVTGGGLKHLAGLSKLQTLNLHCRQLTGTEGLKQLTCTDSLQHLELGTWFGTGGFKQSVRTAINDAGMAEIARLRNLTFLSINSKSVTDDGLKHLAGLSKLQTLRLGGPGINDEGVKHLFGLKNLKVLDLSEKTKITAVGVAAVRKALPGCYVSALSSK